MNQVHRLPLKQTRAMADIAWFPVRLLLALVLLLIAVVVSILLVPRSEDAATEISHTVLRAQFTRAGTSASVDLPHSFLATPSDLANAPVVYRFSVDIASVPVGSVGLLIERVARVGVLYVNGQVVGACAQGPVAQIRCRDRPSLFRVPSAQLNVGVNHFELVVWPSLTARTGLSPPVLGDWISLQEQVSSSELFERVFVRGGLVWVFSIAGGAALVVGWGLQSKSFQCMGIAIVLHSVYRWSSLVDVAPIDLGLFEGLVYCCRLMAGPWFLLGVLHHFRKAATRHNVALLSMSLMLPAALWLLGVSSQVVVCVFVPTLGLVLVVTLAAVRWSWKTRTPPDVALTLGLLLIVFGVFNEWGELAGWIKEGAGHRQYLFIPTALLVSGLSMKIVFSSIRSLKGQEERTKEQLRQREAELAVVHGSLLRSETEASSQRERGRIMRDLHDGLGSSLASAKLAVQSGSLSPADVAQVLQDCLDDMRLVLDTSAAAMLPLSAALADYRYRMEPRLKQAGIESSWGMDIPLDLTLDASSTLSIMRLIQEAITNAVRHAQARHVSVTLHGGSPNAALVITIQDDGIGSKSVVRQPQSGGRGTRNAEYRAQQMGASYERQSGSLGTRVRLVLPPISPTRDCERHARFNGLCPTTAPPPATLTHNTWYTAGSL